MHGMRIRFTIICGLLLWVSDQASLYAQQVIPTHQEYEPVSPLSLTPMEQESWTQVPDGLNGAIGSVDVRYRRDTVPILEGKTAWHARAWRGERVNLQIVLWSDQGLRQLRAIPSALRGEKGAKIESERIQVRFVRYVLADENFYACGRNTQKSAPILVADILDDATELDMAGKTTRPLWVSVDVPADAKAGRYTGQIAVVARGRERRTFEITLDVLPLSLPAPGDGSMVVDLWQNPWAVARYHGLKPWSDEHVAILKSILRLLADAGGTSITTTIVHDPWNSQTYDPYESMVDWVMGEDGQWKFDYTLFDRYVRLAMECGITRYINCYSMLPFRGGGFRYREAAGGDYRFARAEPGTPEFERHWTPFLQSFSRHLEEQGWLDRTYMAFDERPIGIMRSTVRLLRRVAPKLKIALASEDWQEELQREIDHYSLSISRYTRPELVKDRARNGLISTVYPACVEKKTNNYPHSDPAESVLMGWIAAADSFSGFLRWALDSWVEDPLRDTRYAVWNAGECFLIYPGPRSSIRFERLREGFQDYEKIRMVRNRLSLRTDIDARNRLADLERALTGTTYQKIQDRSGSVILREARAALDRAVELLEK